ncbi:hypothetical protein AAIB33_14155 [Microbacterium sp. AZCO]|uniref:hypothetical protein n=1 Tax=Microbacterium sp. AZCO TaxID=3142976 RepID=UPI0031F43592
MDDARANNDPVEEPPTGTDQLAADNSPSGDGGSVDDEPTGEAPTGGDRTTEEQLEADNPAEEDTLKTLDPDAPPA